MSARLATPPFEPLREVVARLERAGLVCALGGSGLLAALGLATEVRDWDLTSDASIDEVTAALAELPHAVAGSSGIHADHKLMTGPVEVIARFSLLAGGRPVRLPTIVTGRWNDVPVGSPEGWAIAYALMGREAKAETLFAWLDGRADRDTVARLLEQPLPGPLRARLAALAPRSD
jgi:hypothetical protein